MKRSIVAMMGLLGLLLAAFSGIAGQPLGLGRSAGIYGAAGAAQQKGVFYARPDPRLCPSPACGGYNLFDGSQPTDGPCQAPLQFVHYVTRIFSQKEDGTRTRINPSCDHLLTGLIEPDPDFPHYDILVVSEITTGVVTKVEQIGALLTGYEESPSVSTTGTGEFTATIAPDGDTIFYTETYSGLQGTVTQSHIHVGQLGVNGSIVIFLCQTSANPDPTGLAPQCPQEGTVTGTITAANVIGGATTSQQLKPGDLAAVIIAIQAGMAYANVHTTLSPGGEIRGQIRVIAK